MSKAKTRTAKPKNKALAFAKEAARIASDNHTEDIVILDLRGLSSVADFFVIGTGTSDRQMRATCDDIEEYARTIGEKPYSVSGYDTATWLLADYVDVVIHLFDAEKRKYYDIELLWGDAPRVNWE